MREISIVPIYKCLPQGLPAALHGGLKSGHIEPLYLDKKCYFLR